MERLTFDGNFCDIAQCKELPCPYNGACSQRKVWERLKAYEDTGLTPEEITALGNLFDYVLEESKTLTGQIALLNRIRDLAEADKDGRLVVLPCKVGDTVYRIFNPLSCEPVISAHTLMSVDYIVRWIDKFGKTVFLTREEAEQRSYKVQRLRERIKNDE